ncbi:MAG: galactokinase [Christensenellaceae bacterium]
MDYTKYYGEAPDQAAIYQRYVRLTERFRETGMMPEAFFSSPGRAEILGNHTDHQSGKVVVAAISCDIVAAVHKRKDRIVEICSEGFSPIRFCLDDTALHPKEVGRSASMARGVCHALQMRGFELGGLTAYTHSTVFRGAGVSSSAAFEVLVAEMFNDLYLDGALTRVEKAAIAQYAENEFFGKPCGLLDQSGIAYGGMHKIDFRNPTAPTAEPLRPPKGYSLVIVNTGGVHSDLTEHYAAVRNEMKSVATLLGADVLRRVPYEKFIKELPSLRGKVSERALLRVFHYYDENARVERAASALKKGQTNEFLSCVAESGESSMSMLQNGFVPGSDVQPIGLALRLSKEYIRDGAVRLHGGGFAGTILAYLADGEVQRYCEKMESVFGKGNVFRACVRPLGACRVE